MSISKHQAPDLPDWLAKLVPFERYLVDVGDQQMHVMESGQGRPVVLLHGNPTWGFLYRKVAAELAGEPLRVIMPDLIGFGFSSRPARTSDHNLTNHAAWFGQFLDALELDDLIFMGQDWGGAIGTLALADRPGRMTGLVLGNTAVTPPKEGFNPTLFHKLARLPVASDLLFRGLGYPQNNLNLGQGERHSIVGDDARAYKYPLRTWRDRGAVLAMAREVPDSLEHRSVPLLKRCQEFVESFEGPAALVWGDRDPVLGRLKNRTARLLPQASVTSTSGGHFLQEQVPVEIADAIRGVAAQSGR
ncbi:MAG TPA: alpha/beta fold hydrolase [Aeromicrobium sp.]|nr:alpha/beta fold hydrolase [Aeromicrobium sp.]HKY56935.1 alpha/beta fold hydrolase [Aeromicrobium sp.]